MNREILFRGKRVDNGEWVYGYYCKSCGRLNGVDYDFHSIYACESGEIYEVIPSTVGQYTGLTDKNGVKIFEGDIVKTKYGRRCKVIWFASPCFHGFDLCPIEDLQPPPDKFDLYASNNLEIIGNIHDNPELLGGENNA